MILLLNAKQDNWPHTHTHIHTHTQSYFTWPLLAVCKNIVISMHKIRLDFWLTSCIRHGWSSLS